MSTEREQEAPQKISLRKVDKRTEVTEARLAYSISDLDLYYWSFFTGYVLIQPYATIPTNTFLYLAGKIEPAGGWALEHDITVGTTATGVTASALYTPVPSGKHFSIGIGTFSTTGTAISILVNQRVGLGIKSSATYEGTT